MCLLGMAAPLIDRTQLFLNHADLALNPHTL